MSATASVKENATDEGSALAVIVEANRMETNKEHIDIIAALVNFQRGMQAIPRRRENPFFHSKYASLDDIWEAIRQPLADNGLAVVQTTAAQGGEVILITTLHHVAGASIVGELPLGGGMTPQVMGSALTYGRRYALAAILGLVPDDDDDAEGTESRDAEGTESRDAERQEHWCEQHHTTFFRKGKMKEYAHPLPGGGWHNEDANLRIAPDAHPKAITEEIDGLDQTFPADLHHPNRTFANRGEFMQAVWDEWKLGPSEVGGKLTSADMNNLTKAWRKLASIMGARHDENAEWGGPPNG